MYLRMHYNDLNHEMGTYAQNPKEAANKEVIKAVSLQGELETLEALEALEALDSPESPANY